MRVRGVMYLLVNESKGLGMMFGDAVCLSVYLRVSVNVFHNWFRGGVYSYRYGDYFIVKYPRYVKGGRGGRNGF
jgi:hypothetical protein